VQDDEGHVNWGVLLFSLLCIACGAVWLGLLRTWCALGTSCLSCPRKQRQVSAASSPTAIIVAAALAVFATCSYGMLLLFCASLYLWLPKLQYGDL